MTALAWALFVLVCLVPILTLYAALSTIADFIERRRRR